MKPSQVSPLWRFLKDTVIVLTAGGMLLATVLVRTPSADAVGDPSSHIVTGKVVDAATGSPVADAFVLPSQGPSFKTNPDGTFALDMYGELGLIRVGADGLQRVSITITAPGYGTWIAKDVYLTSPRIEAQLSAQPHFEDRICIPRAVAHFHPECLGEPPRPLLPPNTGSGARVSARDGWHELALVGAALTLLAFTGRLLSRRAR